MSWFAQRKPGQHHVRARRILKLLASRNPGWGSIGMDAVKAKLGAYQAVFNTH